MIFINLLKLKDMNFNEMIQNLKNDFSNRKATMSESDINITGIKDMEQQIIIIEERDKFLKGKVEIINKLNAILELDLQL